MFVKKSLFCLCMFNAVSFYLKIHLISQIFVCSVALLQAEACLVLNMHKNDHDLPLLVTLGTHTDSVFTQLTINMASPDTLDAILWGIWSSYAHVCFTPMQIDTVK